ncbi:hypothetical protein BVI2075_320317 [Burkholderia vietnamiensis]|nr:hypothetical protein BVI1335_120118 [Burkholderia vietnamiensis]CAG9203863.1 hypothetical protein BVI2075_320317 [Burkholderia vietnamiensis]
MRAEVAGCDRCAIIARPRRAGIVTARRFGPEDCRASDAARSLAEALRGRAGASGIAPPHTAPAHRRRQSPPQ